MKQNTLLAAVAALAAGLATIADAGAQVAAPTLKAGSTWTYRQLNGFNKLPTGTVTREVTSARAGDARVTVRETNGTALQFTYAGPGQIAAGPLNDRAGGTLAPPLQVEPFPLQEGQTWTQKVVRTDAITGQPRDVMLTGKVQGWETVRVPAGEFKALRVERRMWLGDFDEFRQQTQRSETEWYAPDVGGTVRLEVREYYREPRYNNFGMPMPGIWFIQELTAHQLN